MSRHERDRQIIQRAAVRMLDALAGDDEIRLIHGAMAAWALFETLHRGELWSADVDTLSFILHAFKERPLLLAAQSTLVH